MLSSFINLKKRRKTQTFTWNPWVAQLILSFPHPSNISMRASACLGLQLFFLITVPSGLIRWSLAIPVHHLSLQAAFLQQSLMQIKILFKGPSVNMSIFMIFYFCEAWSNYFFLLTGDSFKRASLNSVSVWAAVCSTAFTVVSHSFFWEYFELFFSLLVSGLVPQVSRRRVILFGLQYDTHREKHSFFVLHLLLHESTHTFWPIQWCSSLKIFLGMYKWGKACFHHILESLGPHCSVWKQKSKINYPRQGWPAQNS